MSRDSREPLVSIALPVHNGADTLGRVIESALAQTWPDLELVISDNASTDGTEDLCRQFEREDGRVVYHRHAANVGLLNNFTGAARIASGTYLRWLGDDDWLEPDYLARTLEAFAEDEHRVLVTTQIVYTEPDGTQALHTDHVPAPLASLDPADRFAAMLRLLTSGYAVLDPLYALIRRDLAVLPRRNMLREDEVYAARLALAGPWGHVAAPLARRHRSEISSPDLVRLLGVPGWHRHAVDVLQCRDLLSWVARAPLDPGQRRRARLEVARLYARRKGNAMLRGAGKLRRATARAPWLSPEGAG